MKYAAFAIALALLVLGACMSRGAERCRTNSDASRDLSGRQNIDACTAISGGSTEGLKKIDVTTADPNDRDLGPGADGEKLGNPQPWQGEVGVDPQTGERYAKVCDNPFVRTGSPGGDASTFGLDVDSASYANCRRFLRDLHQLPPAGAVRIEELVNTIAYIYPAPAPGDETPFHAATAVATCPWAPDHRLVRVALRARGLDRTTRPPLNLVFLVDTSGSMSDANKLPLVQRRCCCSPSNSTSATT